MVHNLRRRVRNFFLANPRFALAFPIIAMQPFYWTLVYAMFVNGAEAVAMLAAAFMIVPFAALFTLEITDAIAKWFMKD